MVMDILMTSNEGRGKNFADKNSPKMMKYLSSSSAQEQASSVKCC